MRRRLAVLCAGVWLASSLAAGTARAQGRDEPRGAPAPRRVESYSPYERATIEGALGRVGGSLDGEPEGKIVERVDVISLEVIEPRDPAPGFLNWLHATSRRFTIERELLVRKGDLYRQDLVDETARNLRKLQQISLVLCVAAKGSDPHHVRLVVITKDVWSLRMNSNFVFAGGRLETLLLQPSEENLFGTHHSASVQFLFEPAMYALGGRYTMPKVGGSHIRFVAEANVFINRELGETEGSSGVLSYGQPLYSTEARWSWGATIQWRNEVFRRYCPNDGVTPCADGLRGFDAGATEAVDAIPYRYRSDVLVGQEFVTRSFGQRTKHDISFGMDATRRAFRADDLGGYDRAAADEFAAEVLPVGDTRIGPFIEYRTYATSHMHALDFETLGLQEDIPIGHEAILKLSAITTALNSSRNFLGVYAAARYAVPLGDGMAAAFVESATDIQSDAIPDAAIEAGGRVITPRLGFGRLVVDGRVLHRYRNYLNRISSLGGNTRLRGYPTQAFLGKDVVVANLEFRTRPVEILSCQLGGAVFFDAGDAFDGASDFAPKQSAGFGLRILFPQLDRVVLRADWGFPLTRGYVEHDSLPGDIVVTFRQAFSIPDVPTSATSP